jgi:hypothetical protein
VVKLQHEQMLKVSNQKHQYCNLGPFGYSDIDTTVNPKTERTGNRLHLKTKKLAIKNLLLFKKISPILTYQ